MSVAKKAVKAQLELMALVGQILEANLEPLLNLNEEPDVVAGITLNPQERAVMEQGQKLARQITEVIKEAQDKLRPIEKELAGWQPPDRVLEAYMDQGPPAR